MTTNAIQTSGANLRRGSIHLWQLASLLAPVSLAGVFGYSLLAESGGMITARVIPDAVCVFAPATGEFRPLTSKRVGEWVAAGQILGTINPIGLSREYSAKTSECSIARQHVAELQLLRDHLRIRNEGDGISITDISRQLCSAMDSLRRAESEQSILQERLAGSRQVVCPVAGRIIGNLDMTYAHEGDRIVSLDPGKAYQLELVGPSSRMEGILASDSVQVHLVTPEGSITVDSRPIPRSMSFQPLTMGKDGRVTVLASIRCEFELMTCHGIQAGVMGYVK